MLREERDELSRQAEAMAVELREMAELRRTTEYLRRGLDQAKALTRRRQQQAEAVIVEFAQQEFAYFTSVPERPAGAVAGGKPTAEWSVPYLPPPSVPYLSPQARWRAASPPRSGVPPTSLCTGAPQACPTCGMARARCGSRAGSRSTRAATRARCVWARSSHPRTG